MQCVIFWNVPVFSHDTTLTQSNYFHKHSSQSSERKGRPHTHNGSSFQIKNVLGLGHHSTMFSIGLCFSEYKVVSYPNRGPSCTADKAYKLITLKLKINGLKSP